jgi:hypothetical protein
MLEATEANNEKLGTEQSVSRKAIVPGTPVLLNKHFIKE